MSRKMFPFEKAPIYQSALQLMQTIERIADVIEKEIHIETPDNKKLHEPGIWKTLANHMREDAMLIPAKIAGAYGADLYDIKMQNAAIIRKCGMDLVTHLSSLQMYGFKETEYLDYARTEIDEFRILFAEWVKTFDPQNYIIDRWGLFNPPGVNYDDHDPDDDLPFENPFSSMDDDEIDDFIDGFDEEDFDDDEDF